MRDWNLLNWLIYSALHVYVGISIYATIYFADKNPGVSIFAFIFGIILPALLYLAVKN